MAGMSTLRVLIAASVIVSAIIEERVQINCSIISFVIKVRILLRPTFVEDFK
jgi:hypothetical protein